jgi:hypothetical protein
LCIAHVLLGVGRKKCEQSFGASNPYSSRVVEIQRGNRRPCNSRNRYDPVPLPSKVVSPKVAARVEQRHDLPGARVSSLDAISFVKIAAGARPSEVPQA